MTQSIVITGASQGIGAATARAFLDAGWHVGLMARNAEKLDAVAGGHKNAVCLPADVTNLAEVEAAFDAFQKASNGRIDALFNNAGRGSAAETIDEISPETWASVVAVNLTGHVRRACLTDAIGNIARASHHAMLGRDVDDTPTCLANVRLSHHLLHGPFAAEEHSSQVDGHDPIPILLRGLE